MIRPLKSTRPFLALQDLFPGSKLQSDSELSTNQERDNINTSYYHSIFLEPSQKDLLDQAAAKQLMCGYPNQSHPSPLPVEGTLRHPN